MQIGLNTGYGGDYLSKAKEDYLKQMGVIKESPLEAEKEKAEEKEKNKRSTPQECETCKHRKYKDGSDEMVSFKSAAHIAPNAAYAAVRAHEGEHVSNAYKKAAQGNGKVVSANVAIHTARCPECGRIYVSGGTTYTQIRYYENNPYAQNSKSLDAANLKGKQVDSGV